MEFPYLHCYDNVYRIILAVLLVKKHLTWSIKQKRAGMAAARLGNSGYSKGAGGSKKAGQIRTQPRVIKTVKAPPGAVKVSQVFIS